ncbi:MAG: methionine aminotransferase [Flavobacteriales bacterium]
MPSHNSKLPNVGTTIFTVMSQLAVENGALNLGQGFPGFAMDHRLCDLVHAQMLSGRNQYAPMPGVPELRSLLAQKMERAYGFHYDAAQEITITAGGTQAIFTIISALVHAGDEVVSFAPAYDCYAPAVELQGATMKWVNLRYPDYRIDWQMLRSKLTPRTRMIIINTPHNPTGMCMTSEDMLALQTIAEEFDLLVLSDEVYEHIVFDGCRHESVARYPQLAKRSLVVYSFGKTFHNTGWKMGYVCAPAELTTEVRKVHQYNVFSVNTPVQYALAEYMSDAKTYAGISEMYEAKRDVFARSLEGSRFGLKPAAGAYFQLLDYSDISQEGDVEFAKRLTREHKITGIPCSVFFPDLQDDKVLRFCFAKNDDELLRAAEILQSI